MRQSPNRPGLGGMLECVSVTALSDDDLERLRLLYIGQARDIYSVEFGCDTATAMIEALHRPDLGRILSGTGARALLFKMRAEIVGALIFNVADQFGDFRSLYVRPEFRRMGIGTKLMEAMLSQVGRDRTIPARILARHSSLAAFYERFGFRFAGQMPVQLVGGKWAKGLLMVRAAPADIVMSSHQPPQHEL